MRKIEYNVSSGKLLDYKYFFISITLLILASFLFLYIGLSNIINTNHDLKEKIDKKKYYDKEEKKIEGNEKLFLERIEKIKRNWENRVKFANSVINAKSFPFLERLNYFESILPEMVQMNEILIDENLKGTVLISISSYSTEKLYELYKKLIGKDLVISSESEDGGVYRSKLKVTLKK